MPFKWCTCTLISFASASISQPRFAKVPARRASRIRPKESERLDDDLRSKERRYLPDIKQRIHLDQIEPDHFVARADRLQQRMRLEVLKAADLRRAGARCDARIHCIDIERDVNAFAARQ